MNFNIKYIEDIRPDIEKQLIGIWERSVRKTHDFLTEQDINAIKKQVQENLYKMDFLIGVQEDGLVFRAFMGIKSNKIEMLFVDPISMKLGLGKMLITLGVNTIGARYVDVNLDNRNAISFYRHFGFEVYSYSKQDELGNPFPIIHMKK